MLESKVTGQTKSTGFQIGVRRTLSLTAEQAWAWLTSPEGLYRCLGEAAELCFDPKQRYETRSGASGEIRVVKPQQQLRFTWQKTGWARASTVQIRFLPNGIGKTTVSFHQEHLADAAMREAMKQHWEDVLDQLKAQTADE